jgi:ABC transport system ATP-binding/permease protein
MLRLDAQNISIIRGGHSILSKISLSFQGGELVALLGPSGSGKSTLLKALSGFQTGEGCVHLGDRNLYEEFDDLKTKLGYVPQEDLVHQTLSVEDTIDYSAQLRLDPDIPDVLRRAKVRAVMTALELEGRADTKVKSLSGGQRKRVSVAVELLAEPPILFLDEPTSGLDPALEESSMQLFRRLTDQDRLTIVTTHVMSSLDCVDLVVFLNQGLLVFVGPPSEASAFFGVDHLLSIYKRLTPKTAREHHAAFLQSSLYQEYVVRRLAVPRVSFFEAEGHALKNDFPQEVMAPKEVREPEMLTKNANTKQEVGVASESPEEVLKRLKEERKKQ